MPNEAQNEADTAQIDRPSFLFASAWIPGTAARRRRPAAARAPPLARAASVGDAI